MILRTLGVIPARLASTRLTRKPLRVLAGRPLLAWVVEAARACSQLDQVVVATDATEIAELCAGLQVPCVMTSPDLPSGTDRMHAVAQQPAYRAYDVYVNVQGDEPFLRAEHIAGLLAPFKRAEVGVTTLKVPCPPEDVANPNTVKVVSATDGRALYFSRATIPYHRDAALRSALPFSQPAPEYWKHLGLYAYRKRTLDLFPALPPSALEQAECLEQLRLLENRIHLHVEPTPYDTIGIDTEADLQRAEELLRHPTP
ncbi:MAG: 3-deoxy-manno-octulosonate cytidylyltransferase [Acidobacteriota bacterium]|nr:3-deoxy-manno-octulosonate cytidylyltransferase [Acidobacteriota bacterium]